MELRKQPFHFDSIGLSLLIIVMVSWEVMLSKGQEWDWLGDPFWRVQTLAIFFTVGLAGLIFWELRHRNPVVNFRPLAERNFAGCCIIIFCAYLALYAASTSLPGLLQSLFGYNALSAGLVMSPRWSLRGPGDARRRRPARSRDGCPVADRRWVADHDRRELLDVTAEPGYQSEASRLASSTRGRGTGGMFRSRKCSSLPLYAMALRGAAVGLLSLLRNEGGSVGTSLAQTVQERRDQFHTLRLGEYIDPFNTTANSFIARAQAFFLQHTADPVASQHLAWQELENLRQQQASSLAYFDSFWMLAVLTFGVAFVVLFMKRSVAEKGGHVGLE
jgi:MFS transporter, DHA2 family, multidrug resistance protein